MIKKILLKIFYQQWWEEHDFELKWNGEDIDPEALKLIEKLKKK